LNIIHGSSIGCAPAWLVYTVNDFHNKKKKIVIAFGGINECIFRYCLQCVICTWYFAFQSNLTMFAFPLCLIVFTES